MAPNHVNTHRTRVMFRHHVLYRRFQLLRVERDESGERDDKEYDRYLSDVGYMDR